MKNRVVIIGDNKMTYNIDPPFDPPELYPEYPFEGDDSNPDNKIYPAVRRLLYELGLDKENFGSKYWNPLGKIIKPGDKVLIKPNFVIDTKFSEERNFESAVTHGSVIRPLIDYAFIATEGKGEIIIADGPIDITDFEDVVMSNGCREIVEHLSKEHNVKVSLLDLRERYLRRVFSFRIFSFEIGLWKWAKNGKFPGYIVVDIGKHSKFYNFRWNTMLRSTQLMTDNSEPAKHHQNGKHEYGISKIVLEADVIINVPKLKTHKKTGNTLSLKNMIGVAVPRNWLPHHSYFDEYPKSMSFYKKIIKFLWSLPWIKNYGGILVRKVKGGINIPIKGSHPENDTLWRSIIDINKILIYADKNGIISNNRIRKTLIIIDGIISGEGDAPLSPKPKKTSILIAGLDPVSVDLITTTEIMNFDYRKIRYIKNVIEDKDLPISEISPENIEINRCDNNNICYNFEPPPSWKEYLKRD